MESCPTGALVFGDLDDPASEIAKLAGGPGVEAFHPEYKTDPLVKYMGIPKRFVAGEVVLKDRQGECAQNVNITLEGGERTRTTGVDLFGDFEFEGLEKNTEYRIVVAKDGYAPREITFTTRTDVNLGEIVLDPQSCEPRVVRGACTAGPFTANKPHRTAFFLILRRFFHDQCQRRPGRYL